MDKQRGQAAWKCSMDKQQGLIARTCSKEINECGLALKNGELCANFLLRRKLPRNKICELIDKINRISISSETEEFHAKINEIFDCIEATPNNFENIEISEGVNICVKIVASQCAELHTISYESKFCANYIRYRSQYLTTCNKDMQQGYAA